VLPSQSESRTDSVPGTMKWYGWGGERDSFDPADRPYLWPFAQKHLQISATQARAAPVPLDSIRLPPRRDNAPFLACVADIFPVSRWSLEDFDRIIHSYGKSTRDLWRIRHGRLDFAPDCVVYPESEDEVCSLLAAADRHGVVIVPFGGGTNVAGCVEMHRPDPRMVCTVNMRRMNRVLDVNLVSRTARVQAGILGPDLEKALGQRSMTLGHVPDSFPHSTLGGWVASSSAGMFSDGYGNIEDMVLALRVATPTGLIKTLSVPRASSGPAVNRLCIGSEGTLGIITEVTICIREICRYRAFRGYLFPTFEDGIDAMRECRMSGHVPMLSRLSDGNRTQLSAAFRRQGGRISGAASRLMKAYINAKGFTPQSTSLMICGFEGDSASEVRHRRAPCERIFRSKGAIGLGQSPGNAFIEGKFDFPFVRDFLMDYDVICDVNETATTWSQLKPLYQKVSKVLADALGAGNRPSWFGCHISHTYHAGAMLYFSYAFRANPLQNAACDSEAELAHYLAVRRSVLDCLAAAGATLSHHHAVGYEHLPWLYAESVVGQGTAVDAIKSSIDPNNIMNPGKLSSGFGMSDWLAGPKAREHETEVHRPQSSSA
jgi:alkyldihydroxyacetonephosphate synthase